MENYKYISINDENGYLNFSVKYPLGNEYGYSKKITDIKNNVEYYDIGKKIREIYTMSEEDI